MPVIESFKNTMSQIQIEFWQGLTSSNGAITELINETTKFSAQERFEVYKTTARSVHVAALLDSYPVCRRILGDQFFKLIAKQYFLEVCSCNPDLNNYGGSFAGHIAYLYATRNELKQLPYLPDLARLEWCYQNAYYVADETEFDIQKFQQSSQLKQADLILSLQHGVTPLTSRFPVYEIWSMHQEGNKVIAISLESTQQYFCISRRDNRVNIDLINVSVHALLCCIQLKYTLGEIADYFSGRYDLNAALAHIVEKKWIANC